MSGALTSIARTAGFRREASETVAEPPRMLPPGRSLHVPGRGEIFLRDTGEADRPAVMLLHGWMFSADLNWFANYDALHAAGYRVLAIDHRGHGRGLRTHQPFRLQDCADDVAAVLRRIDATPATLVGYSMGGAIAQLVARDHPQVVRSVVLGATSSNWREPQMRALWAAMGVVGLALSVAPHALWRHGLQLTGLPDTRTTAWVTAELARGSARDMAEAGRELGRFDSRPWLPRIAVPSAVLVTTTDTSVPPRLQRDLAGRLDAPSFDVDGDHGAVTAMAGTFNRTLLRAIGSIETGTPVRP
ncbi:MAG: alpha/beta fold hydrolase [Solirubrobacteraceae bacterium]|nr:alpha/beta fold hydrolase [Solirubrobacteraceae bacterium]